MTNFKKNKIALYSLVAFFLSQPVFADYMIKVPLQIENGGPLPNGSIIIGKTDNSTPTENNNGLCEYNYDNYTEIDEITEPTENYQIGDLVAYYNTQIIGVYSPSNNLTMPAGISKGKQMSDYVEDGYNMYEICGSNLENYPILFPNTEVEIPNDEVCIFNQDTDYVLRHGTYDFYSTDMNIFENTEATIIQIEDYYYYPNFNGTTYTTSNGMLYGICRSSQYPMLPPQ